MSEWAWKNDDSLTEGTTDPDFDAYQSKTCNGETYLFGGPELSKQWLGASPDRVNLGRVELALRSEEGAVIGITEAELEGTRQRLDLRTGTMTSSLQWQGADVVVQTISAQSSDAVGFTATSSLLERGHLEENRCILSPTRSSSSFSLAVVYVPALLRTIPTDVQTESRRVWEDYWSAEGFVDPVTGSSDSRADALQRRIILLQYLMRVNEAGDSPPQELRACDASSFQRGSKC
ncbi:hypothetical protein DICSQDRAFT_168023 [Dichomitus squalens LYAD-421 SS1]|uniref:uncharacterized protein n=1 Tax=Dichomitus squalens (strain LYAD-421) TaxID=732165 RepID=UPI00044119CB|nr:uncharacterized protein DICSQDRAFT_168023 [Dichomitus squalens LYAD-421 SS1]EJF63978.1 hypothetical protein DICSQDRAFT_168023 [Dichomitus squalens LYAD-421 SS1]